MQVHWDICCIEISAHLYDSSILTTVASYWDFIPAPLKLRPYGAIQICLLLLLFLAHQHKACRQLKIKQEMTAVGD